MKGLGLRLICDASPMLCGWGDTEEGDDVVDADAVGLSHVGRAAYDELRTKHEHYHNQLWNVTNGSRVGVVHQTPLKAWPRTEDDPQEDYCCDGHDDWFPNKMAEMIGRTEKWCDVLSLGPPDGMFMQKFQHAIKILSEKEREDGNPIIVRLMFGNIPAMPVNCRKVIKLLTAGIDSSNTNLQLWVGAWRKAVSWNHAKIIAVDGKYLHTGGHNLWDEHYLKFDPVHDLSLEMIGKVAVDGHLYANAQWSLINDAQNTMVGGCMDKMPDYLPMAMEIRVSVSEWPKGVAGEFPPSFSRLALGVVGNEEAMDLEDVSPVVPIITVGRYGSILRHDRPSDDAFLAMLDSAQTVIRMGLQDLGPVCIPGTKIPLPGCVWPKPYLKALARGIWLRGVDVEIVLSNPGSVPGGLSPAAACYGNGWTCVDVASEIIRQIQKQYPEVEETQLRQKVTDNLRICFIRGPEDRQQYEDGQNIGMHAKHFIVDDVCTYIGSQNLYVCDLAEWGVIIDNAEETQKIMDEYWNPMWRHSYREGEDVDVQAVMDGLEIDREGEGEAGYMAQYSEETKKNMEEAAQKSQNMPSTNDCYGDDDVDDGDA